MIKISAEATLEALRELRILVGKNKYSPSRRIKRNYPGFAGSARTQRPEPFVFRQQGKSKSWPAVA